MIDAASTRCWPFNLRITIEERNLLRDRSLRLGLSQAAIVRRGLDRELAEERRLKRRRAAA